MPATLTQDFLTEDERRVLFEKQRGTPITTGEAQARLEDAIRHALTHKQNTLINAPTGLGKTYTIATTPWREFPELTGEQPVIHISQTTEARDEAAKLSREAGVKYAVLRGRDEICPVARGDFDDSLKAPGRVPPSKWFAEKCDREDIVFSDAHDYLEEALGDLPCSRGGSCPSKSQWTDIPRTTDEGLAYDVIHATATFAKVERLTRGANVIFDELPDYRLNLDRHKREHLREAINALLTDRSEDGHHTWENLIETVRTDLPDLREGLLGGGRNDRSERLSDYAKLFAENLGYHAQFERFRTVHANAPAIGRAVCRAYPVGNGRYRGSDGTLTVVFDENNTIRVVQATPDLSGTRCVIGLDAHPSDRLWALNTTHDLLPGDLLDHSERQYWRTQERGLYVVQVDNKTNPLTQGWREDNDSQIVEARAIITELRRKAGDAFRTCICPKSVKEDVTDMMLEVGIEFSEDTTRILHYGGEKSLNVFADEQVGLLLGCIDPGDHTILDNLALLDLYAEPEMIIGEDGKARRAYGRGFVGEDADAADEFLHAVRESHIAQSIGRYARDPRDADTGAVVYVWTNAIPPGMRDVTVPGVNKRVTEKKLQIEQYVRSKQAPVIKREVAAAVGVAEKTAWKVLEDLEEQGVVRQLLEKGPNGAYQYEYIRGSLAPSVDLTIRAE